MLISRNVLSKTRSLNLNFYCDRRINIVQRIKSFNKRIRFHCKIYNEIKYTADKELYKTNISKIQNDEVDYFETSKFLFEELSQKYTFLSNHDLVLILHYLTTIKKQLVKVCSTKYVFPHETGSDSNEQPASTNQSNDANSDEGRVNIKYNIGNEHLINKLLFKCQMTLLKYLLEADKEKLLTGTQRYYLIIILQKECDLIDFRDWLQLYENVSYSLTNSIVCKYKPYQIVNLLLIYDQISRYSYKRHNGFGDRLLGLRVSNDSSSDKDSDLSNELTSSDSVSASESNGVVADVSGDLRERRVYDPFNLDFVNLSLHKIESRLNELKPEKIIKLLYLINSRQQYSNNFFQNSILHFENNKILKALKIQQVLSLFNTYSNAYTHQALSYIENFINNHNLLEYKSLLLDDISQLDETRYLITQDQNTENELEFEADQVDDDHLRFNKLESLGFCVKILVMECVERIPFMNSKILQQIEGFPHKLFEKFDKDHEWKDIIKILEQRFADVDNSTTHNHSNIDSFPKSFNKLNHLLKINQILLNIFKTQDKFKNRIKTVQFSIDFFTTINSQYTNLLSRENLTENQKLVEISNHKHTNKQELVDSNSF